MPTEPTFDGLDPEVRALLNEARQTTSVAPASGLIAAMTAAVEEGQLATHPAALPRRKTMLGKVITAKALAIAGALALSGGAAAAATGTLPDPVQTATSDVVDNVGINIPKGEHGAKVSTVARDKSTEGREHGEAVSTAAKDNHGHATTTTVVGDDENSGPGNSRGHANDHATNKDGDDGDDETTVDETTSTTTKKDHPNKGKSGDHTDAPSEHPSGSDD